MKKNVLKRYVNVINIINDNHTVSSSNVSVSQSDAGYKNQKFNYMDNM